MKGKKLRKLICASLSAVMVCSSAASSAFAVQTDIPVQAAKKADATGTIIYSTDFEDGDVSKFANRGGDDTTEIAISSDEAVSGSKSLLASGRTQSWNGPSFRIDDVCKPNTEYLLTISIKAKYYAQLNVSFQYDDAEGTTHYSNLAKDIQSGGWQTVSKIPVSYSSDMKNVFVYVEGGQDDLYIDDFCLAEAPEPELEEGLVSIAGAFANDFRIGTAVTPEDMSSKAFMKLLETHFYKSITVGNQLKPDYVLNQKATLDYYEETGDDVTPQISFAQAKPVLDYCQAHKIPVRLHTLVWHSQTPEWFFKEGYDAKNDYVSKEKMLKRMENYIKAYFETITELYPDIDFYACDVVNEAWLDDGVPRKPGHPAESNQFMASDWVAVFGDNSFIEPAFTFARKYAPAGCKLYYNDFNEYTKKMQNIYDMAMDLKAKGVIDGIGMQSHLDVRQGQDAYPSLGDYEKALQLYTSTGLDVQITELDATVPEYSNDKYFEAQATYYKGLFNLYEKYKDKISAVVFWGINDKKSWRATQNPLLFDDDFNAKPAFHAIMDGRTAVEEPTTVTTTATTTTNTTTTTPTETTTKLNLPEVSKYGDANCDTNVNMADAVLIMQSISNGDEFGLGKPDGITLLGMANADVAGNGDGVTLLDAQTIQAYTLELIDKLPYTGESAT